MQVWYKAIKACLCFLVASSLPTQSNAQQYRQRQASPVYHLNAHQPELDLSVRNRVSPLPPARDLRTQPDSTHQQLRKPAKRPDYRQVVYGPVVQVNHQEPVDAVEDFAIEPLEEFNPVPTPSTEGKSCHLVIQPPVIQPYKENQYTFIVQNLGQIDAVDVVVEITVPETARIVGALPDDSVVTDHVAKIHLDRVQVSEHVSVHLTAVSELKEPIRFQAKMTHSSGHEFGANSLISSNVPSGTSSRVNNTGGSMTLLATGAASFEGAQASHGSRQVPIVTARSQYQHRPNFQRNPHFDSGPVFDQVAQQEVPVPTRAASTHLTTELGPVQQRITHHPRSLEVDRSNDFVHPDDRAHSMVLAADEQISPSDVYMEEPMVQPEPQFELVELSSTTSMSGARTMDLHSSGQFTLKVTNPLAKTAKKVLVQLIVPEGMHVTSFDRQTWYDEETRTLSFRLPKILPGESETIRYSMRATEIGFQIQKLVVESKYIRRSEVRFDTLVEDSRHAAQILR